MKNRQFYGLVNTVVSHLGGLCLNDSVSGVLTWWLSEQLNIKARLLYLKPRLLCLQPCLLFLSQCVHITFPTETESRHPGFVGGFFLSLLLALVEIECGLY